MDLLIKWYLVLKEILNGTPCAIWDYNYPHVIGIDEYTWAIQMSAFNSLLALQVLSGAFSFWNVLVYFNMKRYSSRK